MRDERLFPLFQPLDALPGIGPKLKPVLERLVDGEVPNQIVVPKAVQEGSLLALNRMLAILK